MLVNNFEFLKREYECNNCEHLNRLKMCNLCKCIVKIKMRIKNQKCPDKRW